MLIWRDLLLAAEGFKVKVKPLFSSCLLRSTLLSPEHATPDYDKDLQRAILQDAQMCGCSELVCVVARLANTTVVNSTR